jgi:hypothetical protein
MGALLKKIEMEGKRVKLMRVEGKSVKGKSVK